MARKNYKDVKQACPYPVPAKCSECACWKRCVFNFLKGEARKRFVTGRQLREYRARQLIFRQGESPRGMFVLCSGHVRLVKTGEQGKRLTLRYLSCGEMIDPASYWAGGDYCVSAETVRESIVCFVPSVLLKRSFADNKEFQKRLIESMGRGLCGMMQRATGWALRSADARLAEFLLSVRNPEEEPGLPVCRSFEAEYNRADIAQCVGLTRETVTRRLSFFQRRGLIRLNGRTIHVLNPAKLRRVLLES